MSTITDKMKRLLIVICILPVILSGCSAEKRKVPEREEQTASENEKGYDLPVDEQVRKAAVEECRERAGQMKRLTEEGDSGNEGEHLSEVMSARMMDELEKGGMPVSGWSFYQDMRNYEEMDAFLTTCAENKPSEIVCYKLYSDEVLARNEFMFDGEEMYLLSTTVSWNTEDDKMPANTALTRIRSWEYTERGWFIYELCTPEPPEVTEVVDGSVMLRVKPFDREYARIAEDYLSVIGYQGNNLFCSEWDENHMEKIDYNGLFEYLYELENGNTFDRREYENGIPAEDFEHIMTAYLPISISSLREYAEYDEETQRYEWIRLSVGNYAPRSFWSSVPEIIDMQENEDGTVSLTVNAVCRQEGSENVLTHVLRVEFAEEGRIRFLGNTICENQSGELPEYQYRVQD